MAPTVNRVKPRAFEPKFELERNRYETSVFRTTGLSETAVWALGIDYVAPARQKQILARGDLPCQATLAHGLAVVADDPPPRHAVIVDWPPDKDARKSIQQELAAVASLRMI